MTREEEIFEQALDFDSDDERRAFLAGACAGDTELATTVAELLAAFSDADQDDFLHSALGNEAPIREEEGSVIGRYKLLQKIGEGGFGVVYMAEQREPVKRRVALKIIKLGMDTKHVVGRFEAERQALAMMEHPNIANVLDAGATEHGRPYFVMELVRGIPVTTFCDEKQLSTEERLTLFLDICSAVQHAHQKGIIHRDLKPNNVLVTVGDDGNRAHPKVIDFGIAKATQQELTDKTLFTRFEDFVGTPAYMSPEQAEYSQLDIDTRTDIYSLGVLLYELLAGSTPFDSEDLISSGLDEIRRRIREEEPPRPSTRLHSLEQADRTKIAKTRQADPELLSKKLRNEIDWIIMKAIDKDRSRRYGTAEALADDIENYLSDAPVEACPPTPMYRLKKAMRRNKGAVTVAAAVVAALALGAIASTWQAVQTAKANERGTLMLRDSYLIQANATRKTTEPGRHRNSLAVLAKAAAIEPSVEQRNEAIAAMALPDMALTKPLDLSLPGLPHAFGEVDADGVRYVVGTPEGEVKLFRYESRSPLFDLPNQGGHVKDCEFSPNGKYLAVYTEVRGPDKLAVWDLDAKELVLQVDDAKWRAIAFDSESKQVAVGRKAKTIRVFNLETAQATLEIDLGRTPERLSFDPSGSRLGVTSGSPTVGIFDLSTGSEIQTLTHLRTIMSLAWHPDGKLLAAGAAGFSVVVFNVALGAPVELMRGHQAEVVELEFHRDGRFLASASWDGTFRIWEHRSGRCVLQANGYFEHFFRDGKGFATHLHKNGAGNWAFTTGAKSIAHYRLEGLSKHKVVNLAFSPDSQWLAGSAAAVSLWDMRTRRRLIEADIRGIRRLKFEANGRDLLISGDVGLRRFQIETGVEDGQLRFDEGTELMAGKMNKFTRSPDGHTIATFLRDRRKIHLLDAATGVERGTLEGPGGLSSLSFDPTGRWMASGCWQGSGVRVWDLQDPTVIPVDLMEEVGSAKVYFDPEGETLIVATGLGYVNFKVGSWEELPADIDGIGSVIAFHPTEDLVAVCRDGVRISLLDRSTRTLIAEFEALNPGRPTQLIFSQDGTRMAMATSSRDVTVWNLPELRKELAAIGLDWE